MALTKAIASGSYEHYSLTCRILRLSVEKRIKLAGDIWDSVAAFPETVTLTEEQRDELDRCLAAYEKNPDEGIPWEEFRKQLGVIGSTPA